MTKDKRNARMPFGTKRGGAVASYEEFLGLVRVREEGVRRSLFRGFLCVVVFIVF